MEKPSGPGAAVCLLAIWIAAAGCTSAPSPRPSTGGETNGDSRARVDDVVGTEAALEPFIGMDGSEAYAKLRRQHFEVRFGPQITRSERNNIRGNQTHPDVVIEALELRANEEVIITDVSCTPRSEPRDNYC